MHQREQPRTDSTFDACGSKLELNNASEASNAIVLLVASTIILGLHVGCESVAFSALKPSRLKQPLPIRQISSSIVCIRHIFNERCEMSRSVL